MRMSSVTTSWGHNRRSKRRTKGIQSSDTLRRGFSEIVLIAKNREQATPGLIDGTLDRSRQKTMVMRPGLTRG